MPRSGAPDDTNKDSVCDDTPCDPWCCCCWCCCCCCGCCWLCCCCCCWWCGWCDELAVVVPINNPPPPPPPPPPPSLVRGKAKGPEGTSVPGGTLTPTTPPAPPLPWGGWGWVEGGERGVKRGVAVAEREGRRQVAAAARGEARTCRLGGGLRGEGVRWG